MFLDLATYRPRIIAMYFDEPDSTGHKYGPDANEVSNVIAFEYSLCIFKPMI